MNSSMDHSDSMDITSALTHYHAQHETYFNSRGNLVAQIYGAVCKPTSPQIEEHSWRDDTEETGSCIVSARNLDVSTLDQPSRPIDSGLCPKTQKQARRRNNYKRVLRIFHLPWNRHKIRHRLHSTLPTILPDNHTPRYVDWDLVIIERALQERDLRQAIRWVHLNFDIHERYAGLLLPVEPPARLLWGSIALRSYAHTLATRLNSGYWVIRGDVTGGLAQTIVDCLDRKLDEP